MLRPKTPLDSFRHALNGVLLSFRTQRHLRIHFMLAATALMAGLLWRLDRVELLVLMITIALVIIAELFNTALETAVDLVTPDYHPLAKVAKDVAAGAVLVASLNAVIVGSLLFLDVEQLQRGVSLPREPENAFALVVIGLLFVLFLLVHWKVRGRHGRFLYGGVVSGHAAIAFFFCTVTMLISHQLLISLIALLLAFLVAQSRVEAGIHSVREVLLGALLGVTVPVVLYRVAPLVVDILSPGRVELGVSAWG